MQEPDAKGDDDIRELLRKNPRPTTPEGWRRLHRTVENIEERGILDDYVDKVLDDPEAFLGKRRQGFDVDFIRRDFGTTHRDAQYVAKQAWATYQDELEEDLDAPVPASKVEMLSGVERLALEALLAHSEQFLNTRKHFDAESIRRHFRLTHQQARFLAKTATEVRFERARTRPPPAPSTPVSPPDSPSPTGVSA